MNSIISALGSFLGYIMKFFYDLLGNYALSIIVFTIITRLILLPISIWVHKNSIKIVKLQPEINFIKVKYAGDREIISEKQFELYKKEKYSPMAGIIPLFIQLGLLMGVVDVIYKPLKHLLHLNSELITAFVNKTIEITNIHPETGSIELSVLETLSHNDVANKYIELQKLFPNQDMGEVISMIQGIDTNFLGLNLSNTPVSLGGVYFLVPIIAGATALLMCIVQNNINVLQSEQSKLGQISMTILSVGLSLYLGAFVPSGVGFYWICGNIFAIVQLLVLNMIINPKKYIDYEALENSKKALAEIKSENKLNKNNPNKLREKADYKKFFKDENKKLVFYSESSGFYKYFENVIEYILKNSNIVIHYVTSDPNDAIFQKDESKIIPYYIGERRLITFMMKMDADIVVMTMPDLEKFHIKRSYVRKDVEYIFMFHGPLSMHMTMREGCVDNFDTIFCVGPHIYDEIRKTEEIYNLPSKNLIKCGYGVLETLTESYDKFKDNINSKTTILIAPSWQKDNIVDSCIHDIINNMKLLNFKIIVRPHPEFIKRFPNKVLELKNHYCDFDNIEIETDFSRSTSIYEADLLISDWSGVAYEYAFATKKPVLFINTAMKVMNPNYTKLGIEPLEISLRNKVGISLDLNNLDLVEGVINKLLSESEIYRATIDDIVNKYFYNFGESGKVGGQYIINKLKNRNEVDN